MCPGCEWTEEGLYARARMDKSMEREGYLRIPRERRERRRRTVGVVETGERAEGQKKCRDDALVDSYGT
jgi:hypothetical protein